MIAVLDVFGPCLKLPLVLLKLQRGKSFDGLEKGFTLLILTTLVVKAVDLSHLVLGSNLLDLQLDVQVLQLAVQLLLFFPMLLLLFLQLLPVPLVLGCGILDRLLVPLEDVHFLLQIGDDGRCPQSCKSFYENL